MNTSLKEIVVEEKGSLSLSSWKEYSYELFKIVWYLHIRESSIIVERSHKTTIGTFIDIDIINILWSYDNSE